MTLNDVMGQLTSVFIEWEGVLKDPQYIRNEDSATWANAEIVILPETITKAETFELSRRRQFTFRVSADDSVVQMSYRFNHGNVTEARLAYYEVGLPEYEDDTANVRPSADVDWNLPARWIRFDYRKTGLNQVLHMDSHLHVSGLPGTRFAVAGLLTPKQFIEFIIAHFYPDIYEKVRLAHGVEFNDVSDSINASCFDCGAHPVNLYQRITHLRIPAPVPQRVR
jgi:hypothetical protein